VSTKDTFDTLSALDIAEQLTYLDHKIYIGIRSEELLGQAWMKPDKSHKAPHVLLVSKRFNEVSRLVVSEIVGRQNLQDRVSCIEKWAAIADICRCMHNYNGVLQICAAFVNSSVYRLKKTWEKLSKQTKQMIERLQVLVSSDGRFKNMRDALHRYTYGDSLAD
ncbi:ras-specific guanine nucleotide-releasing factor 2-like, partial [Mizuhopecten yessoensis]